MKCSTMAYSELDLFGVLSIQTSIDAVQRLEHLPIASLDSGGPIEFVLPGSVDASLDPANSYLFERAKVIQADGMNIDASEPVGPVNNDTLVTFSTNT